MSRTYSADEQRDLITAAIAVLSTVSKATLAKRGADLMAWTNVDARALRELDDVVTRLAPGVVDRARELGVATVAAKCDGCGESMPAEYRYRQCDACEDALLAHELNYPNGDPV